MPGFFQPFSGENSLNIGFGKPTGSRHAFAPNTGDNINAVVHRLLKEVKKFSKAAPLPI